VTQPSGRENNSDFDDAPTASSIELRDWIVDKKVLANNIK
jgi:hypothetical protein